MRAHGLFRTAEMGRAVIEAGYCGDEAGEAGHVPGGWAARFGAPGAEAAASVSVAFSSGCGRPARVAGAPGRDSCPGPAGCRSG